MTLRNAFADLATEDTSFGSAFERLKNGRIADTDELRLDVPASLVNAAVYRGVAPDGTATSAAAWTVMRTDFDATGMPTRERLRTALTWDGRASGW